MENKTFNVDFEHRRIVGMIDDPLEAVKQAAFFALNTPRFECLIFSSDYGHEFNDLIGKEKEYADGEIRRMLEECLKVDERILSVENLEISKDKENYVLSFSIQSIYGEFEMRKEVANGI